MAIGQPLNYWYGYYVNRYPKKTCSNEVLNDRENEDENLHVVCQC